MFFTNELNNLINKSIFNNNSNNINYLNIKALFSIKASIPFLNLIIYQKCGPKCGGGGPYPKWGGGGP